MRPFLGRGYAMQSGNSKLEGQNIFVKVHKIPVFRTIAAEPITQTTLAHCLEASREDPPARLWLSDE